MFNETHKNNTCYLVQNIAGGEYNIFNGTEKECKEEEERLIENGENPEDFNISTQRYNR